VGIQEEEVQVEQEEVEVQEELEQMEVGVVEGMEIMEGMGLKIHYLILHL
jgi:hypothetical protein